MQVEPKIMEHVKTILTKFGDKYIVKDNLKKNRVIEDLDHYDPTLMTALLSDDLIHKTYTEKVLDTEIFKLNQFIEMFEYKDFWEDSYTKYQNEIGLNVNGEYLKNNSDVVLDFPFKDCVLKASMSKEDMPKGENANEPFLNETLAAAEIDELFEPKVLVNAKKYDQTGEHSVTTFSDNDNLVIKGNNLIALHSIKKRYQGKVKLIYLDPPFDTRKDYFLYNDKFNRSSWLTFMKSRLEISKLLLSDDGSIFVHIDAHQSHYLKILLDEIFSETKFMNEIIWRYRTYVGQVKDYFPQKHDNIFWYINKNRPKFNVSNVGNFEDTPDYKRWKKYLNNNGEIVYGNHPQNDSRFNSYLRKYIKQNGNPKIGQVIYKNRGYIVDDVWEDIIALDAKNKTERLSRFNGSGQKPEALLQRIISSVTNKNDLVLDFFMGSGTTQAVAMKMHRRFIGIEQMDYINTVSVPRLQKVIAGEQGGISKDVDWHGGGSFVYAELMEKNMGFLKDLQKVQTLNELNEVYERMKQGADFDFKVDLAKFEQDRQENQRSLDEQKQTLIRMLDKNQLYYNEANLDDADVRDLLNDNDYQFNKSFYQEKGEE